ncbi:hypothetical protein CBM2637_A170250 [Cupriavidus taiwanensis]|nr:hypothetical protein CBM2637_A170250 [Cupriavidus taiwanensis]SPA50016.1 protein of unknown function [Cupriavidus taiwanensis]
MTLRGQTVFFLTDQETRDEARHHRPVRRA